MQHSPSCRESRMVKKIAIVRNGTKSSWLTTWMSCGCLYSLSEISSFMFVLCFPPAAAILRLIHYRESLWSNIGASADPSNFTWVTCSAYRKTNLHKPPAWYWPLNERFSFHFVSVFFFPFFISSVSSQCNRCDGRWHHTQHWDLKGQRYIPHLMVICTSDQFSPCAVILDSDWKTSNKLFLCINSHIWATTTFPGVSETKGELNKGLQVAENSVSKLRFFLEEF